MSRMLLIILTVCGLASAAQRPSVRCTEDSPERRGEVGCTILANRPLHGPINKPMYWHLDRFDSLEAATKVAGPDGVAAEAHGSVWLMAVETRTESHHGGHHVAWIGPLEMPAGERYSMRVLSSMLEPGTATPVHTHSGPEAFYVVAGEQCLETPERSHSLGPGQSLVLPAGVIHRGRPSGSSARRVLALNLYDSARPVSHDLGNPPPLVPCKAAI
ncbi:cupin domain-containing protein [Lysobacter niastensis]